MKTLLFILLLGSFIAPCQELVDTCCVKMTVRLREQQLLLRFKNVGNSVVTVPNLKNRVGKDGITLDDKFYFVSGDTLKIFLRNAVDQNTYVVTTSAEVASRKGQLFYVDKSLTPKSSYRTSIKVRTTQEVKFLMLQYENSKWACPMDRR